jgi:hypothetical protein
VRVSTELKKVITTEMSPADAEVLCADLFFLLECTKDLAGMVPGGSVLHAEDCRKRLAEFLEMLRGQV